MSDSRNFDFRPRCTRAGRAATSAGSVTPVCTMAASSRSKRSSAALNAALSFQVFTAVPKYRHDHPRPRWLAERTRAESVSPCQRYEGVEGAGALEREIGIHTRYSRTRVLRVRGERNPKARGCHWL